MSIPAVLGAEIGLSLIDSLLEIYMSKAAVGIFASFIVSLLTIRILIKFSRKVKFWFFAWL